jgi:GTP-binding protein EngB required for normal cell division
MITATATDSAMSGLGEHHKRQLLVTFAHVDELLSQALRDLDPAQAQSPFSRIVPDAVPVQQQVLMDYAARLRRRMQAMLERQQIAPPERHVSAVWSARTAVTMAEVALDELRPQRLRGYGELSVETAAEVNAMIGELYELLSRLNTYLAAGTTNDLHARLGQIDQSAPDVRLLRELERMITVHGLVPLRPALEMLVERLESDTVEVALFGRVNSGKSSLLNRLLGTEILPVGVTPITAVPTRVRAGASRRARVWFAGALPEPVEPDRLADFVSENANPSNAKHVTRIEVELAAPALEEGVVFVDTPGLGSLAAAGAAESLAYLPRCDLGLVLVDAASTLTPEDLTLVDALYRAGAGVMLLLTKADLLSPPDRERTAQYLRQQFAARLGVEVPVYLVSVRGADAALCDRWVADALRPALRDRQRLANLSLGRKIETLRRTTLAALKRRCMTASNPVPESEAREWRKAEHRLDAAQVTLSLAESGRLDDWNRVSDSIRDVLDEVANQAAARWYEHDAATLDMSEGLRGAVERSAARSASLLFQDLLRLRSELMAALNEAGTRTRATPVEADAIRPPAGLPAVSNATTTPSVVLHRPLLAIPGRKIWYRSARRDLEAQAGEWVGSILGEYARRLNEWRQRMLADMRRDFMNGAESIRAQGETMGGTADIEGLKRDVEALSRDDRAEG